MIAIFPLWTFYLYVATLQQPLHMEYLSLSWYGIPWKTVASKKEANEPRVPSCYDDVVTAIVFWSPYDMEYMCNRWPECMLYGGKWSRKSGK